MNWISKVLLCLFSTILAIQSLDACTAFQLKSLDGANLYCRSMEYGLDLKSNILIAPIGSTYQATAPNNQTGMQWKSKYGFIGLNQWFSPQYVSDGMNEKGLVVGVLYLPGFAEYEKPNPDLTSSTLGAWELSAYLLGTCASLDDVKTALTQVLVAQQPIPGTNFLLPIHFYIGDNKGKVLIVEYINGTRYEYDNPVGVLTNSPSFNWHLENLSNYVNLSPTNASAQKINDLEVASIGQGSGLLGLPGDYTPPSRFVRAALYSSYAMPDSTAFETARSGFHVLNTFDIFFGAVRNPKLNSPKLMNASVGVASELEKCLAKDTEYTQWAVVHDRSNLKTYFRSYESLQIQMVDLKKIDFTQPGFKQIDMQQTFAVDDVTNKIHPMK